MEVLFRSPLGALLAKPWVDQAGLFGLKPVSYTHLTLPTILRV